MRRRNRRVEQRIRLPHVADVVDAEIRMLEEVRGLLVDLEWVIVVELINIEPLHTHLL